MICDRTLYERTPALLQAVDAEGGVVAVSDRWLATLGYDRETVIGRPWQEFLTPESQIVARQEFTGDNGKPGTAQECLLHFVTCDRGAIALHLSAHRVQDEAGTPEHWLMVLTEATVPAAPPPLTRQPQEQSPDRVPLGEIRQHLQQAIDSCHGVEQVLRHSEAIYRASFDQAPVGVVHATPDLHLQRVNPYFCQMLGYGAAELQQLTVQDITHPDDRLLHTDQYPRLLRGDISHITLEKRYQRKDGSILWASTTLSLIRDHAGHPLFAIAIVQDISDRKAAELALQASEQRFRLIAETIDDVFWIDDVRTRHPIYSSPKFEQVWGLSPAVIEDGVDALWRTVHPEDRVNYQTWVDQAFREPSPHAFEFRILHPSGQVRWLSQRCFPVLDESGTLQQIVGITTDISDRKASEAALRTSEERFRLLAETIADVFWLDDIATRQNLYVSPAFEHLWQMSRAAMAENVEAFIERVHPEDRDRVRAAIAAKFEIPSDFHEEYRLCLPDGTVRWIRDRGFLVFDEAGQAVKSAGIATDITAQKQSEARLHQYERIISATPDPICLLDRTYTFRLVNQAYQAWQSHCPDLIGTPLVDVIGPDFFEQVVRPRLDRALAGETLHFEEWAYNPGQRSRESFISITYAPYLETDSTISGVVVSIRNLTALKTTRDRLTQTTERLRLHMENSPLAVIEWDSDLRVQQWSPRAATLFGWSEPEVRGKHFREFPLFPPGEQSALDVHVADLCQGQTHHQSVLTRNLTRRGKGIQCEWYHSALLDDAGNVVSILSLVQDVSDRKQAELELRSSQQLLQYIFDTMPQRVFWKDCQGVFMGCNRAFAQDMGVSDPTQIIGKTDDQLPALAPSSVQVFRHHDQEVIASGKARLYQEQPQHRRDGTVRWLSTTKLPLQDEQGQVVGVFGIYEDITEQKLAQIALQRYARMVEVAADGICLLDRDYRYQVINRTYADWYGDGQQPIVGQTVAEVLGQDAFERRLKTLLDRCLAGETVRYANWFDFPRQGRRFRSITLTPYGEATGEITGVVTSIRDWTDLKQAESRQQELLDIIEATPDCIGMATPDGQVTYLNPAFAQVMGLSSSEVTAHTHIRDFHPQWTLDVLYHDAFPTAIAQGTWQGETALLDHTGAEIPISQTITVHRNEAGQAVSFSTIIRDIRRLKAMETQLRDRLHFEQLLSRLSTRFVDLSSEELSAGIQQALEDLTTAVGVDRSYIYLLSPDQDWGQLFGEWHSPQVVPMPPEWQTIPAAPFPWWMAQLHQRRAIALTDPADLPPEAENERLALEAFGTRSLVVVPMFHSQTLIGYIGFSTETRTKTWSPNEITLLNLVGDLFANAYRRQQGEMALRNQRHYFQALTEQTSEVVVLLDAEGHFQYVTPATLRILGYGPEALIGQPATDFVKPEDVPKILRTLQQAIAHPRESQPLVQYQVRHKNGHWRTFEATTTSLLQDPMVRGVVVNCRDVSDRVAAEMAQRQSDQRFQAFFEQSAISMAKLAIDGTYIRVNPAFCQLVGYAATDLTGKHYATITHPDDLTEDTRLTHEVASGQVPSHFIDKRFIRSDGSIRYVQLVLTAVQGDQDTPRYLASVYNDITDRVLAETALRSVMEGTAAVVGEDFFPVLAQKLAEALAVDHVLINQLQEDTLTTLVHWSEGQLQPPFSYPIPHTPCARTLTEGFYCCPQNLQATFPEDADLALFQAESYLGVALTGEDGTVLGEICVLHRQPVDNLENAAALLRIFAARASAELERQWSNQALRDRETHLRSILDNMPILLDAIDDAGTLTLWNHECERVTGYRAEEVIGNPDAFALFYPDAEYRQTMLQAWAEQGNNFRDWEWTLTCKDGSQRIIAWSNIADQVPIPGVGIWCIGVDVTDRRLAENALRESEARFQSLAANMPGIIFRYHQEPDGSDRFSYVSPGSRALWELEPEAVYADAFRVWNLIPPEDQDNFREAIVQAAEHLSPWFHEYRIVTPSGQEKWLQGVAQPRCQPDGSYLWDGVLIDVTDRKRAELALRESEARFQRLAANMPGIIYRYHRDREGSDRFSYLSPTCRDIWELDPDVLYHNPALAWQAMHPEDRDRKEAAIRASQEQQTPCIVDYRIITASGQIKWLQSLSRPVMQDNGSCFWDGLIIDITQQKATEQALRDSEALNRAILGALPDLLMRLRRDGLCLDMQYPSHFHVVCPKERHIGRRIQDTLAPDVAAARMAAIERALATGKTQIYEFEIPVTDTLRWEESRVVPLNADEVLVLVRDIDDRKRAEAALRQSEAMNRAIVEALPDMLIRMGRDGVCLGLSHPREFRAVVPSPDAIGRNILDMLPRDLAEERLALAARALATGKTQISEYQLAIRGQHRWEEARIVPLAEDEVLILVRDIEERKQAEAEIHRLNQILEEQNQHLESLVEQRTAELLTFINSLPDYIFVVERDTMRMPFCNDVLAAVTQQKDRKAVEGKTIFECFPPEHAHYYAAQNRQVFASGETLHIEEHFTLPEGDLYLDTYKIPLKRPNGEVYALIGTSRDITELVQTREQLMAQTAQLEATNQELQAFSYSVSHDLRAPLRHINGFIAALKKHLGATAETDARVAHYLEVISKSSEKMGLLIDGLLTLSRVGRRELAPRPVALHPLVENTLALLEVPQDPTVIQVTLDDLPTVQGDATLLQQVFTNLLDNALKFSRDRHPARLHIGYRPADGVLFVQDNGVGFDMAYADKLFSPFQRLHRPEDFKGTGIGLAIVQRIIHRHGGHIWVESALDQGTTFFFTLPTPDSSGANMPG